MKLLRVGQKGKEKPAILDKDGKIKDISSHIKDLNPNHLNFDTISKLKSADISSLPELSVDERIGSCITKPGKFIAIGLNFSDHFALADGIVKTDYELFLDNLPSKLSNKVVSAEELAIRWIETRTEKEMMIYDQLVEITHGIINEAFSTNVITPGVTTTNDVVWWMREKVKKLGLKTWFHPTIDVQRNEVSDLYAFDGESKFDIIIPGDLIHCDFGISYLTLNTDCQELAYVLKPYETKAPDYLCLLYTSPSPRDATLSRMPSSA